MNNTQDLVPADQVLPHKLLIVPMQGKPIFPGILTPLMVRSDEDVATIEASLEGDSMIGLCLVRDPEVDDPDAGELFPVGTVAKIVKRINLPDGGMNIFISTLKRFVIRKSLQSRDPITVAVDYLDDVYEATDEGKALTRALISEMKQLSENNPLFSEEMRLNMVNIDQPGKIADFITSILNIDRDEQQTVLETLDVQKRMEQVLVYIKKEKELLGIQKRIQKQINEKIEKSQREYFLKEELKAIKSELGMDVDAKSSEYQRFRDAIEELPLPEEVREPVEQELEKFSLLETNSPDFGVTRNYLDTIINLPWGEAVKEDIDLSKASAVLDKDHYGMRDVKDRILEYLAVRKMKTDARGSIICLVGPPGVGKTSIGMSIAGSMDKKFFRFSVGGMRDEAEIKGHRRTYVGAMPGKIIQGLKIVKSKSPVFLIDEIDKLSSSYQGDPSSALLEVLDPEQNVAFRDHYLDLPFDISHVLFIVTANTLETIPRPLLDRMEVIQLSGYIEDEKVNIASKYLIPKSLDRHGLRKKDVKYPKATLRAIANEYAREAGMRTYEKLLDRIHRKVARSIVEARAQQEDETAAKAIPSSAYEVTTEQLEEYLGKAPFREDAAKRVTQAGMAIGLAWTPLGGDTLIIEAVSVPGKAGFKLTGKLGDVMQESAGIAYTYIRKIAQDFGIDNEFFEKNTIHLHIPAGATPKEGPSAGITMATTLLSLARGKAVKQKLGMTGELSLSGRVLPIGGLKEKLIAARRAGLKTIMIPSQNEPDLSEIPDHIKKGLKIHPVSHMDEVLPLVF